VVVNNQRRLLRLVLLPDLFSSQLDTIADDIQVVELAKYTESCCCEMTSRPHETVRRRRGRGAAVLESVDSRKVIGFLTESFAAARATSRRSTRPRAACSARCPSSAKDNLIGPR